MKSYNVYFHDGYHIEINADNVIFRDDFSVTFILNEDVIARFNLHEIAGYAIATYVSCGRLWS